MILLLKNCYLNDPFDKKFMDLEIDSSLIETERFRDNIFEHTRLSQTEQDQQNNQTFSSPV